MASKVKKDTKKGTKMPMKEMPKKPKCVIVTSPASLSVRDIISAISEFAPAVKSSQVARYLNKNGFDISESQVRAHKAVITRSVGA